MNRAAFFEAAGELTSWIATLSGVNESALRVAEDLLCRKREALAEDLPDEAILLIVLGVISGHIEEVMAAFDQMCQAAGRAPRFQLALRLIDAPRLVQWEIQQGLEGKPADRRHR